MILFTLAVVIIPLLIPLPWRVKSKPCQLVLCWQGNCITFTNFATQWLKMRFANYAIIKVLNHVNIQVMDTVEYSERWQKVTQ